VIPRQERRGGDNHQSMMVYLNWASLIPTLKEEKRKWNLLIAA
jgi:hypothetical protein